MEIKNFDSNKLDDLIDIFLRVYNGPPWFDNWKKERALKYLNSFISDPCFIRYLAFNNGILIGACFGARRYWWKADEYYINEIFIEQSNQRQGIGTEFINKIQDDLIRKEIRTIILLTDRNTPANEFYKKAGFQDNDDIIFKYKQF